MIPGRCCFEIVVVVGFNSSFRTFSKVFSACWIANMIVSSSATELGGLPVVDCVEILFWSLLLLGCFYFMYVRASGFFAAKCLFKWLSKKRFLLVKRVSSSCRSTEAPSKNSHSLRNLCERESSFLNSICILKQKKRVQNIKVFERELSLSFQD